MGSCTPLLGILLLSLQLGPLFHESYSGGPQEEKKGVFPVMKGTKRKLQRLKTGLYLSLITVALESSE